MYRVVSCDGVYDLIVSLTAKDVYKLHQILKECCSKNDINFLAKDNLVSIIVYHGRREYLLGKTRKEIDPLVSGGEKGSIVLDEKD